MDALMKLSREAQVVLGGGVVLLILSFLNWQQVSYLGFSAGFDEWRGIGLLAGLLIFALLGWEAARIFGVKLPAGAVSDGLVSVGLALLLALFTVIYFLTHGAARNWPARGGLLVVLVVAAAAVMRAKGEGVQMPAMGSSSSGGGAAPPSGGTGSAGGDMGSSGESTEA